MYALLVLDLGLDVTKLKCITTRLFTKICTPPRTRNARRKVLSSASFSFPSHVAFREDQSLQIQRDVLVTDLGLSVTNVGCFADVMGFTMRVFTKSSQPPCKRNTERRVNSAIYLAIWQSPPSPSCTPTTINICCSRGMSDFSWIFDFTSSVEPDASPTWRSFQSESSRRSTSLIKLVGLGRVATAELE